MMRLSTEDRFRRCGMACKSACLGFDPLAFKSLFLPIYDLNILSSVGFEAQNMNFLLQLSLTKLNILKILQNNLLAVCFSVHSIQIAFNLVY
ncbi:hypothetical protein T06_7076 [Trichinella sp. T6]|nr:hypothetical protein T06_7076 [Trichinella sp. T6]